MFLKALRLHVMHLILSDGTMPRIHCCVESKGEKISLYVVGYLCSVVEVQFQKNSYFYSLFRYATLPCKNVWISLIYEEWRCYKRYLHEFYIFIAFIYFHNIAVLSLSCQSATAEHFKLVPSNVTPFLTAQI